MSNAPTAQEKCENVMDGGRNGTEMGVAPTTEQLLRDHGENRPRTLAALLAMGLVAGCDTSGWGVPVPVRDAAFGVDAAKRHSVLELPSNEAIRSAVEAGAGLAIMSRLVVGASIKAVLNIYDKIKKI